MPRCTSSRILFASMMLCFGISIASCAAIRSLIFVRSTAYPRNPSLVILFKPHNQNRDVVRAAAFIGEFDQFFRCPEGFGLRLERSGDFRVGDHTGQSIGTEQ